MARLGVVSAGLVIARRVSIIATGQAGVCQTRRDKIRMMVGDLALGLTFPIGQLVICKGFLVYPRSSTHIVDSDWFVQGHRFDIFEGLGCSLAVPNTILATLLSYAWPLLIGLASAYYSSKHSFRSSIYPRLILLYSVTMQFAHYMLFICVAKSSAKY